MSFSVLCYFSILLFIPAAFFAITALYFSYARYLFSPAGKNVQEDIRNLILQNLDWDGRGTVLEIGCGSGALAIAIAKKYPDAKVVGTDSWGRSWEYSQRVSEKNARIENVSDRVKFQVASASSLPFSDNQFDVVISNLVFHEVKETQNKQDLIREALRVVRKGGKFVFQDLFYLTRVFGEPQALVKSVENLGVQTVKLTETRNSSFIPNLLKLPFMVGTLGLLKGEK